MDGGAATSRVVNVGRKSLNSKVKRLIVFVILSVAVNDAQDESNFGTGVAIAAAVIVILLIFVLIVFLHR